MGNNTIKPTSQTLQLLQKDYKELRKQNNGKILYHLTSMETYFLKQMSFISQRDFQREVSRLQRQLKKDDNQNIIKLVKMQTKQFNHFCSNSFKIYAVYEYPEITLSDQIVARKKQSRYFQECDLWSILQSCVNALTDLKPSINVHPSKVYILSDGLLKLLHNDMADEQYRCLIHDNIYYAPQKITNFNKSDKPNMVQKQAIFSMGMTLLSAAILQDLYQCYDYKNQLFIDEPLQDTINQLTQRYTQQFIGVIATIVQPNPNRRPSLTEIQQMLNSKWNEPQSLAQSHKIERQTEVNKDKKDSQRLGDITNKSETPLQLSICKPQPQQQKNNDLENQIQQPSIIQSKNSAMYPYTNCSNQYSYETPTYNSYVPLCNNTKENIFTDPKLLEMIRKDLQQINSIKKNSTFLETYNQSFPYPPSMQTVTLKQEHKIKPRLPTYTTVYQKDGIVYEGMMLDGKKQGKGKLSYPSGAYYVGCFKNDQMDGEGNLYYGQRRPAYEGNWKHDHFHGKGILYNQNPIVIQTQFSFQNFDNLDEYWVKYEGDFQEDNKSGKGTITLSNGEVFQGIYTNDMANGPGKFTNIRGEIFLGKWENNILVQIYNK